jgi:LmbE family N-acetylglucosaminyl deacetylase
VTSWTRPELGIRPLADFVAVVMARAHREIAPRAHWRRLASRHPILGATAIELAGALSEALAARTDDPREVVPLPGLTLRGGAFYYAGQQIGVANGTHGAWTRGDFASLIGDGFAFEVGRVKRDSEARPVLVFSPHPDDAPLALGGTLALRTFERPIVFDVFTVSNWIARGLMPRTLSHVTRTRIGEERLAARILDYAPVFAGFWEITMRYHERLAVDGYKKKERAVMFGEFPGLRTEAEHDAILRSLEQAALAISPMRIYAPLAVGRQSDHLYLRDRILEIVPRLERMCDEIVFYEDQPYSTYDTSDAREVAESLRLPLVPELTDITETFELKMQAIAAHASQFTRAENEGRLLEYARRTAYEGGLPNGRLAERVWKLRR